jgi:hypothetical protein
MKSLVGSVVQGPHLVEYLGRVTEANTRRRFRKKLLLERFHPSAKR